jgi:hypothetical protein
VSGLKEARNSVFIVFRPHYGTLNIVKRICWRHYLLVASIKLYFHPSSDLLKLDILTNAKAAKTDETSAMATMTPYSIDKDAPQDLHC